MQIAELQERANFPERFCECGHAKLDHTHMQGKCRKCNCVLEVSRYDEDANRERNGRFQY